MKQYRIRFSLSEDLAEKLNRYPDRSALIAEALKWYLTSGKETLDRLTRIESMLSAVMRVQEEQKPEEIKNDDIDDIFGKFTI